MQELTHEIERILGSVMLYMNANKCLGGQYGSNNRGHRSGTSSRLLLPGQQCIEIRKL